ncbi:MAG: glycosyltransferase family 4 protein [Flavobacteriales bacterium]|nr:glycosyltransferase family 4 protein [Flavobacteriales bacterium]
MSKKILFLTTELPFPPNSGGTHKSFQLLKRLGLHYSVDLVCFVKSIEQSEIQGLKNAVNINQLQAFVSDIPRSIKTLLMSYLKSDSLNIFRNFHAPAKDWIDQNYEAYDLIFVDHYEMFQYVLEHTSKKQQIVFHEHNAEYILWERAAMHQSNPAKKIVLQKEAQRVKKAEQNYCNKADYIWAAPNDIEKLVNVGVDGTKCHPTYHLGNDTMLALPELERPNNKHLLYIGTLSWEPNVDGLCWFLDDVWPSILSQKPNAVFNIIGKGADTRLQNRANKLKNVNLLGFVDDLEDYYNQSRAYVVPLRFGSGIKVKVLDGMYRGIPCVTTSIGAEGLSLQKEQMLIQDTPDTFGKAIIRLFEEDELWDQLSINSRKRALQDFTWDRLMNKHLEQIQEILS